MKSCLLIALFCCVSLAQAVEPQLPTFQTHNGVKQLFVDGRPYLALGGELGNSSAADLQVLDIALDRCSEMRMNTIMLPVYWDRIESEEGKFDFSLLQGAIEQARRHHLRLVLLWFGTWKNSMSCYVPGWMKRESRRFERAKSAAGETLEIISPTCDAAAELDARAFSAVMAFAKQFDATQQTVIMVQVENEMGMLVDPRDHSESSQAAYAAAVPAPVIQSLGRGELGPELTNLWKTAGSKTQGSWSDLFGSGDEGQEVFTAWQLASYTEKVAAAGKKQYPLPMYVNAALTRPGRRSAGGPLPHLMELWHLAAPSIDLFSPDIYFPNFADWAGRYVRGSNPLFVPEMAPSTRVAGNALYAIAQLKAIGYGPFAIEEATPAKRTLVADLNQVLQGMSELILEAQQKDAIVGLTVPTTFDWNIDTQPQKATLGGIAISALFDKPGFVSATTQTSELPTLGSGRWEAPVGTPDGAAMVLQVGPEEFVMVGRGVTITFASADGKGHVGLEQVQEGHYDNGRWIGGRWLNGDQTHQGRHVRFEADRWGVQRVRLYHYE